MTRRSKDNCQAQLQLQLQLKLSLLYFQWIQPPSQPPTRRKSSFLLCKLFQWLLILFKPLARTVFQSTNQTLILFELIFDETDYLCVMKPILMKLNLMKLILMKLILKKQILMKLDLMKRILTKLIYNFDETNFDETNFDETDFDEP